MGSLPLVYLRGCRLPNTIHPQTTYFIDVFWFFVFFSKLWDGALGLHAVEDNKWMDTGGQVETSHPETAGNLIFYFLNSDCEG